MIEHAHLKTLGAARHSAADAAEADDAEGLAPNIAAEKLVEIPTWPGAGAHPLVAFDQPARDRHQQRPREVGGRFVENAGGVRGENFVSRAGGHVDIVVADGNRSRDAKLRRLREQFLVHFFGEQADERVFFGHAFQQFGAGDAFGRSPIFGVEMLDRELRELLETAAASPALSVCSPSRLAKIELRFSRIHHWPVEQRDGFTHAPSAR